MKHKNRPFITGVTERVMKKTHMLRATIGSCLRVIKNYILHYTLETRAEKRYLFCKNVWKWLTFLDFSLLQATKQKY